MSAGVHTTPNGQANLISYTFWKCGVNRGLYTVRIQWRTHGPHGVGVTGHTLIVEGD